MRTCNYNKRCRKRAVLGFRPYKDGWDVTSTQGIQYRCELHGKPFMRLGKPGLGCWAIPQEKVS